jgi:hypothetical protein
VGLAVPYLQVNEQDQQRVAVGTFYFKAGAYLGANESNGSGYGQTSFYALSFNHNGVVTSSTQPTPTPNPMPGTGALS